MSTHQIDISSYEQDPRLFLFTSLTAGSSHIITATSRLETILKANKIPFQAIDLATDEKARRLWQRRARERKLPGLVKEGFVLGDLDEIEEWNEFGELKENIGAVPAHNDTAGHVVQSGVNIAPPIPINPTATQGTADISQPPVNKAPKPGLDETKYRALPGAAEIAARNKPSPEQAAGKSVVDENVPSQGVESMNTAPKEKEESISVAKKLLKEEPRRGVEHLSAPPSAFQSGTATPEPEKAEPAAETTESADAAEKLTSSGCGDADKEAEKLTTSGSGDADEEAQKLMHRGSEVKDVSPEEIKKIESENSLAEADEEAAGVEEEEAVTESKEASAVEGKEASAVESKDASAVEGKEASPVEVSGEAAGKDDAGKDVDVSEQVVAKEAPAVQVSDVGEGKFAEGVKEQSAKEGEDAGKSVGD